jgi:HlyD family secretion protein
MHAANDWQRTTRRAVSTPGTRRKLGAAALLVPLVLLVSGCGSAAPSPTAIRVAKGSVARTVSATGTLQPISEQRLGFAKGGKLVALLVSVGQQVNAGQVLARIDDFDAQADLDTANAKLARQQAALDKLQDSTRVDAAQDDQDEADRVYDATKDQRDTLGDANDGSLQQAQSRLDQDRDLLGKIQAEAQGDQARCNQSLTGNSHRYDGYGDNAGVQSRGGKGLLLENPLDPMSPSCNRAEKGKSAVAAYQRRIQDDQRQISASQRRADIDDAQQRVAAANARRDATAARDAAQEASTDHPHDIDEQQAEVTDARNEVVKAQRELRDTTLIAPVAGTISSINGAIGEYLGSGTGTTAQAPGSLAALPDTDSGTSSGDPTSSGGKTPRPGGSAFVVLKNVNSFQIVVPFEESDAALIQANQQVDVNFDAVPGLTRHGTVASISPTGTQIQDVNNYYATVVLNDTDPRLRGGQTAETKVVVGGVNNVLVVPTAAIQRGGTSGIVQVLQPDGTTRRIQVQLGLIGDTTTQILEGLSEGQQVVIAQS